MDGIHDLGGKDGHGRIKHDQGRSRPFAQRWEAAVFAMSRAGGVLGAWNNSDRFRHAIERIDPVAYLSHGYYGRWLGGIETLLCEAGLLSREEIDRRVLARGGDPADLVAARPEATPPPMGERSAPGSYRGRLADPRFKKGDQVVTATQVSSRHTRLPAYARGKCGKVIALHDDWVLPDSSAHGLGESPCQLYTVAFSGAELWGGGDPRITICLDLFEPYLLPVDADNR